MTKVYVLIDDGSYPTFFLTTRKQDRAAAVQLKVEKEQLAKWKTNFLNYQQSQSEIQKLVETYSPAKLVKKK